VLLLWTLVIAATNGRTPLEMITPDLDRRLVAWVRKYARHSGGSQAAPPPVPSSASTSSSAPRLYDKM